VPARSTLSAPRAEQSFLRTTLTRGAQLTVLSAFALAEPLLDILGRNPEFFAVRRSTSGQIVLFALALILVPPAVLLAVELLVGIASRGAAELVHLVFIALLVAVIGLHVFANRTALSGVGVLVLAAVVGVLGVILYRRIPAVGSFLTVLAPAPLIFLALFLFDSGASKLVFVNNPQVHERRVDSTTPVVLIVFDEFAPVALMNADERIDAARYPNFAALAHDSTWYRSATTVQWLTEVAVPAVLTGILPPNTGRKPLPIYADHPDNIFTLLGGSYRVRAVESITQLCPTKLCKEVRGASPAVVSDTTRSLTSDAGIVYLHLLLPRPYSDEIPEISDSWGDFGQNEAVEKPSQTGGAGPILPCGRNVCRFTSLLSRDRRPTLYVLHTLLPHVPYLYLPSGQRYGVQAPRLRGIRHNRWTQAWPALQADQRYLLQVGYTDRALGLIVRRLKAKGIYNRALVIVVADHGVSNRNGQPRRRPTPGNLQDIAFVPLFVKLPNQHRGRIDDGFARTIDVVPTIAHVLGVKIPWHVDGKTLVGRRLPSDATVRIELGGGQSVSAPLSVLRARRARALAQQLETFGGTTSSVYRIGPDGDLVGRAVSDLPVRPSEGTGVELEGQQLLGFVDTHTDLLPTWVEGRLTGKHLSSANVAIAVNGRVAAVTKTFEGSAGTSFAAMVPASALRNGHNDVSILLVRRDGGARTLEQLRGSSETTMLARRGGREVLVSSDGTVVPVRPRALRGAVEVQPGDPLVFAGWAAERAFGHRADSIAVIADGNEVFASPTSQLRPHRVLGQKGQFGFQFELPKGLLPSSGSGHEVRVLAIRHGLAMQLRTKGVWPWGTQSG
jgi:hypothetical protein